MSILEIIIALLVAALLPTVFYRMAEIISADENGRSNDLCANSRSLTCQQTVEVPELVLQRREGAVGIVIALIALAVATYAVENTALRVGLGLGGLYLLLTAGVMWISTYKKGLTAPCEKYNI